MGEGWYTFKDQGREARNLVLLALTGKSNPKASQVYGILKKDKQVIRAIVLDKDGKSFTLDALRSFYVLAIEKIEYDSRRDDSKEPLKDIEHLNLYFKYCRENDSLRKLGWGIPNGWTEPRISGFSEKEVVRVLDLLNCDEQVKQFNESLENLCRFYNFPVIAPTFFAQKWLLKRLFSTLRNANRFNHCSKMYLIDVDSLQCSNYSTFLNEIINVLSIPETRDLTDSEKLCKICDSNLPTVLVIKNFREYSEIMDKFTANLAKFAVTNSILSPSPRLVIFWIDEFLPSFNMPNDDFLTSLDPLNKIAMGDITKWVDTHKIEHKILAKYEPILKSLSLESQKPHIALGQICEKLDVYGGMATIKKNWDLSA